MMERLFAAAAASASLNELGEIANPIMHDSQTHSYRNLFRSTLSLDPLNASLDELMDAAGSDAQAVGADRDDLLALLLTRDVEPQLPPDRLVFVHDYPASQAALARLGVDRAGEPVALRFEVYLNGTELANGFHELLNAEEQTKRFSADNEERARRGLPAVAPDERLLAALRSGLPDCAGVAVGFDRLVLLAAGASSLDEVIAFPIERA